MAHTQDGFPSRSRLWRGAVLATIAAAIWVPRDPDYSDKDWDGVTYLLYDGQGGEGAVVFGTEKLVGAFFDHESDRSPIPDEWSRDYDWQPYFAGAPADLLQVAEREVLPHIRIQYRGIVQPIITAACWGRGDQLTGAEAWAAIIDNGGFLLETEVMEPDDAMEACRINYEFTSEQMSVLGSLFERRMASRVSTVVVAQSEVQVFRSASEMALMNIRRRLGAVGIMLP